MVVNQRQLWVSTVTRQDPPFRRVAKLQYSSDTRDVTQEWIRRVPTVLYRIIQPSFYTLVFVVRIKHHLWHLTNRNPAPFRDTLT